MTSRMVTMVSLALCSVATIVVVANSQELQDTLVIDQPIDDDAYAASREVKVRTTVNGDLVAAGQRVTVDGDVAGDIIVAAQDIEVRSVVADDLRAAGQHVRVTSRISGHVVAAGQTVTIEESVGDWAWLAGQTVEVLGNVGGTLKVHAKTITLDAEVAGNVEMVGDQLVLGPKAIVRGNLTWRSNSEAVISPDAQIIGEFTKEPLPEFMEEFGAADAYSLPISLIVAVMALFLLFSRPLRASVDRVVAGPGRSFLLGLVVFCATPILAVLLLLTGVGGWLGLTLIFGFLALLLLGVLTGLFAVSDMTMRRFLPKPNVWQSLAAILVTVVAVSLLWNIPKVGFILFMVVWLVGIGALCWSAWAVLRSVKRAEPQPE